MRTYLVGYDLNRPGQDYEVLFEEIKKLGATWHYLDSTWVVKTSLTAVQIRERLDPPVIDKNDSLLVVRLQGDHAGWLPEEAHKWLNQNVTLE